MTASKTAGEWDGKVGPLVSDERVQRGEARGSGSSRVVARQRSKKQEKVAAADRQDPGAN
jgi:hypothetical protein